MDFQKRSSANWPLASPSASRETRRRGSRFGVRKKGSKVWGWGFFYTCSTVQDFGVRLLDPTVGGDLLRSHLGVKEWGSGLRVQDSGFRV